MAAVLRLPLAEQSRPTPALDEGADDYYGRRFKRSSCTVTPTLLRPLSRQVPKYQNRGDADRDER